MNIFVRLHQAEQWQWHHNWEAHHHRYHGTVTFRLMREHPGPGAGGWIPLTFHTVLTLGLSNSNPFAQPPPLPSPQKEKDLMDIDLPEDYVFYAPSEDSDYESCPIPIPVYSLLPETKARDHSSDEEIVMTDFDQSDDSEIGEDELMSVLDTNDEDKDMGDSEEGDPKEDLEEEDSGLVFVFLMFLGLD